MKLITAILFLFIAIHCNAQKLVITNYLKCDQIGFAYNLLINNNTHDTCIWNIMYKPDTATLVNYDCRLVQSSASDTGTIFASDGTTASRLYNWGTTSTFNYIHQTGIFRIEILITNSWSTGTLIFVSNRTTSGNGIYITQTNSTDLNIQFGSGAATILNTSWTNVFDYYYPDAGYYKTWWSANYYKLILVGDGTGVTLYRQHGDSNPDVGYGHFGVLDNLGKKNFTGSIVASGNASTALAIGGSSTTGSKFMRMGKMSFWTSQDESAPYALFPLNGINLMTTETLLGLTGTKAGSLSTENHGAFTWASPCTSQGWKYAVYDEKTTEAAVSLQAINRPIYIYAAGTARSFANGIAYYYGIADMYLLAMPRQYPVKLQKKYIKNGTLIFSTTRHDLYSYGRTYSELSTTVRTVPTPVVPSYDTTDHVCMTAQLDSMFYGILIGDSLVWSSDINWGSKSYRDQLISIYKPVSTSDAYVYQVTYWSKYWCNGDSSKRWYLPIPIRVNHRITTWY